MDDDLGVSICDFFGISRKSQRFGGKLFNEPWHGANTAGAMLTFEGLVQDIIQRRGKLGSKELDETPDVGGNDLNGNYEWEL